MKTLLALSLLLGLAGHLSAARPIVRVPGAVYLYDFDQPALPLRVLGPNARAFSDPNLTRYIGTLRFPQTVQASAFLPHACRISGNARQGRISAWIPYRALEPLPENFLKDLNKAALRRERVEELIAQNEAAIGMTKDEVRRALGRPQRTTRRADRGSSQETWEFVRYRLVPQTFTSPHFSPPTRIVSNRGVVTTSPAFTSHTQMVRVPVGKTEVTFENGVAIALHQSEGAPVGGRPRVVAPPFIHRLAF